MSDNTDELKLNVVLYWHMHQPEYRDLRNGEYHLPWTYLHTIKDYVDMAAHLESHRNAKAVVNFAPILLEQIDDYAQQLNGYLNHGQALTDPLLSALAEPVIPLDAEKRLNILKACLRANKQRLIDPYEKFKALTEVAENIIKEPEKLIYYSEAFFSDVLVWYHIAWMAETVRVKDERIIALMDKGQHYNLHDRHTLIEVINELVGGVINRYRKLAEEGVIEISMTPYAHPILPLLLDLDSTKQAMPEAAMPKSKKYPGGDVRSHWHMQKGIETFRHYFGFNPQGCWPSEGSISEETLTLIQQAGIKWVASGETVLRNSMEKLQVQADNCIHDSYYHNSKEMACFFRDDGLSDLIGFKYSDWHADDAVANLVHHLESIAQTCVDKPDAIVSIILDGENAWEYYPNNGYYFLDALYEKLSSHPVIQLTTYSEYLKDKQANTQISKIVAGSWVYGTFSTWIGDKDKNRAWDMLVEVKQVYDKVVAEGKLSKETLKKAELQLATCESSDWFWWFGEYNSADAVAAFDEQYRLHLGNLYQLLSVEPPEYLAKAFSFGSGDPAMGGAMLPGQQPGASHT